jgi:hypothetical protein
LVKLVYIKATQEVYHQVMIEKKDQAKIRKQRLNPINPIERPSFEK